MRRENSRSLPRVANAIPGTAPILNVRTIGVRLSWHAKLRKTLVGSQFATTYVAPQIYGDDTPLFTRHTFSRIKAIIGRQVAYQERYFSPLRAKLRKGRGLSITAAPPVDTPRFVKEIRSQNRQAEWKIKRDQQSIARKRRYLDGARKVLITSGGNYSGNVCDYLSEIQRHFLEPTQDGGQTWQLWTAAEVLGYFNQRLSRFLLETGVIQKRSTISATAGTSTYDLPADLIDLRRASWGLGQVLSREDEWSSFYSSDSSSGTPEKYAIYPVGSLKIKLLPTPDADGTVHILYVPEHSALTGSCVANYLPNFFMPFIKWGIIADMLAKEGEANDPTRAAYAEERFQEGIDVAKAFVGKA